MNNSLFAYMQLVELLAFFSGYPLIYVIIIFYAGKSDSKGALRNRLVSNLSYAYALVGTLYFTLQLKNLYPDYSIANINNWIHSPWLVIWGLLSLLFWIPAVAKKAIRSLLHSLVFFLIIVKDLFSQFYNPDNYILRNDMKLFTYSLLVNLGAITIVVLFSFLFSWYRSHLRPHQ